jgi:alanyl-tRNA synthetase
MSRTGEIGLVRVLRSAVSAGVRRIEALTGEAARQHLTQQDERFGRRRSLLKTTRMTFLRASRALMDERSKLERELTEARKKLALGGGGAAGGDESRDIGGVEVSRQGGYGVAPKDLKGPMADAAKAVARIRRRRPSWRSRGRQGQRRRRRDRGPDRRLQAVDLVRAASEAIGGKGGGGRPDMAQAGGPDGVNANAAIDAVPASATQQDLCGRDVLLICRPTEGQAS